MGRAFKAECEKIIMQEVSETMQDIIKEINNKNKENKMFFLSERDIQGYIYHRLKQRFGDKYCIHLDLTLSDGNKKPYIGVGAKNVKQFSMPDIIIANSNNLEYENVRNEKYVKRALIKDKGNCFAVEIKFIKAFHNGKGNWISSEIIHDMNKLKDFKNSMLIIVDQNEQDKIRWHKFKLKANWSIPQENFVLII